MAMRSEHANVFTALWLRDARLRCAWNNKKIIYLPKNMLNNFSKNQYKQTFETLRCSGAFFAFYRSQMKSIFLDINFRVESQKCGSSRIKSDISWNHKSSTKKYSPWNLLPKPFIKFGCASELLNWTKT